MQNISSFNEQLGFRKQPAGFATKSIHVGQNADQWKSRAVVPPIVTSTTFEQASPGEHFGFQYSRFGNPTRDVLDTCLASLDNAKFALTFSAGVGAISAIIATLKSGDAILTTKSLYGGTIRLFRDFAVKLGIEVAYVEFDDLKSVHSNLKSNTKLVWIESPTNPLMTVLDIQALAEVVHSKYRALLVIDNTFLTPYLQRPLELGADAVMYSLSKYINGHSDVTMGAVTTNNEKFYENLKFFQVSTGVVPSPGDCYKVNRSLKTLALRMEKHSENSYAVAQFLSDHPKIEKVFHPSLKTHAKHEVALKQSYGHSGVLSFYISGGLKEAQKFFKSLKLILVAESLGGVETNASFPWNLSHGDLPEAERIKAGVTENLIRISVGLEDVKEIIADLDQALANV